MSEQTQQSATVTFQPTPEAALNARAKEDMLRAQAKQREILKALRGQPNAPKGVSVIMPEMESVLDDLQRRYAPDTLDVDPATGAKRPRKSRKCRAVWVPIGMKYDQSIAMGREPVFKPEGEGGSVVVSPGGLVLLREPLEYIEARNAKSKETLERRWASLKKLRVNDPGAGLTEEDMKALRMEEANTGQETV